MENSKECLISQNNDLESTLHNTKLVLSVNNVSHYIYIYVHVYIPPIHSQNSSQFRASTGKLQCTLKSHTDKNVQSPHRNVIKSRTFLLRSDKVTVITCAMSK